MSMNDNDDDFEPQFAVVPEGEHLEVENAGEDGHARRAAIGITAASYNGMVVIPRAEAAPMLRALHAEPLPFGGYTISNEGKAIEIRHLDIVTAVCERYFPDIDEFLYGPAEVLEPALRGVNIEPVPLPADFMDPFERSLARYAVYTE